MDITQKDVKDAVELLRLHNKWRRGDEELEMQNSTELGRAIEIVCNFVELRLTTPTDMVSYNHDNS